MTENTGQRAQWHFYAALIVIFCLLLAFFGLNVGRILGVRLLFDHHDIGVYFRSSRWVVEGGRLYLEVHSEYPPLANFIFASLRYLSSLAHPGEAAFAYVWLTVAGLVYAWAVSRVAAESSWLATLAWLAPGPIYFALLRFDVYPAVATLLALFAIRREAYIVGALWLGIAVALKGYALCMLPAFCVFIFYQRGLKAAFYCGAIVLAPMALSLIVASLFSGWEGASAPFQQQAARKFNWESTYDAFNYLVGAQLEAKQMPLVPQALQLASGFIAALMRPRTFSDLVNALLFAVLGFMTFSTFYSPQFVLWILPLVCFSDSRLTLTSAIVMSWLTYLYFPIGFDLGHGTTFFKAVIVAVTLLRIFMMSLTLLHWYKGNLSSRGATCTESLR